MNRVAESAARAGRDVAATRSIRRSLMHDNKGSGSFLGSMIGSAKEHGVVGAGTLHKGFMKAREFISDADTYLGSMAAGEHWNAPGHHSLRKTLFTDSKDTLVRDRNAVAGAGQEVYRKYKLPSISSPAKEIGIMATPMLAMGAAYDTVDKLRGRSPVDRYTQ